MTNQELQIGSEVWHKSGGPKMVVIDINTDVKGSVTCRWWNPEKNLFDQGSFLATELTDKDPKPQRLI